MIEETLSVSASIRKEMQSLVTKFGGPEMLEKKRQAIAARLLRELAFAILASNWPKGQTLFRDATKEWNKAQFEFYEKQRKKLKMKSLNTIFDHTCEDNQCKTSSQGKNGIPIESKAEEMK